MVCRRTQTGTVLPSFDISGNVVRRGILMVSLVISSPDIIDAGAVLRCKRVAMPAGRSEWLLVQVKWLPQSWVKQSGDFTHSYPNSTPSQGHSGLVSPHFNQQLSSVKRLDSVFARYCFTTWTIWNGYCITPLSEGEYSVFRCGPQRAHAVKSGTLLTAM